MTPTRWASSAIAFTWLPGNRQEDSEEAKRSLARAGLQVLGIRPVEPSLEDVFVSVLSEHGKGQEGSGHGSER